MRIQANEYGTWNRRRWLVAILAITALAFGIRMGMTVLFVGMDSPPDISASPDQAEYDAILQQLVEGNGYARHDGQPTARRAPGMVFTLLPVYAVTGGSYTAVRLTLVLLSAMTCLLVGLTTRRVFSPVAGLIAAGIMAVIPGHTYYAMHLLSEAPFGFWLSLAVYMTVLAMHSTEGESKRSRLLLIAGLFWGMAVLTKPQFILLAPLATLAGLTLAMHRWDWRPAWRVAVCLTAAAVIAMPWYVRNAVVMDDPGLSTLGGYGLWAGNNELTLNDPAWRGRAMPTSQVEAGLGVSLPEGEAASNAQARAFAVAFISEHRAEMPRLIAWKVYRLLTPFQETENRPVYWAQAVSWILLAPLFAVGVILGLRRKPVESLLWISPILVTIAVTLVYFAIIRYRDALIPAMVPFASLAIDDAWRRWRSRNLSSTLASIDRDSSSPASSRLAA